VGQVELSSVEMKKMKSFRLYVPEPPATPSRVASDFTMEEKAALNESFAPELKRYHTRARITAVMLGGFVACILVEFALPKAVSFLGMLPMGLLIAALLTIPQLPSCPGCHNRPDRPFGEFCPECGSKRLKPNQRVRQPMCGACGKQMRRGKSRGFKICYCTHCGFHLDKDGL
jgi:hypothetical protein